MLKSKAENTYKKTIKNFLALPQVFLHATQIVLSQQYFLIFPFGPKYTHSYTQYTHTHTHTRTRKTYLLSSYGKSKHCGILWLVLILPRHTHINTRTLTQQYRNIHQHIRTPTHTHTRRTRNWSVNYAYATLSPPSFRFLYLCCTCCSHCCCCCCCAPSTAPLLVVACHAVYFGFHFCVFFEHSFFPFVLRFPAA